MSKSIYQDYNICAVFADIEDSTGIANYYDTKKHKEFLKNFHDVVKEVLKANKWNAIRNSNYHGFIGDEFKAFIKKERGSETVSLGLELAVRLKCEWYLSEENKGRILKSDKEPIELNIGMNFGEVFEMPYPVLEAKERKNKILLEGFPISIAKRVQDVFKESQASRIILADRAYREFAGEVHTEYDFYYRGLPPLKNLAQPISCYEYLGGDLSYLYPDPKKNDEKEKILKTLYEKYPHNPWYASLLAHYYYTLAEYEWYNSPLDKLTTEAEEWYRKTYDVCLNAIQTIKWSKLRMLSSRLLTCLDVLEGWEELCYRAEQMFVTDPTFADALAMKSKGKLGQYIKSRDKTILKDCQEEAQRAFTLFHVHGSKEYDALFIASIMLFYYHSIEEKTQVALGELEKTVKYVEQDQIRWAYDEFLELLKDLKRIHEKEFAYLDGNRKYERLKDRIKKVSENNN